MKLLLWILSGLLMLVVEKPQPVSENTIPLCHGTPNSMALLAANPAFQQLHANPLPYTYRGMGEPVSFSTPDGKNANGFLLKPKKASTKWLLVYQEWWGLNEYIKQESEKLFNDLGDVNVLAVDMYDGKVAAERAEAAKLVQSASKERLGSIMQGAINYAGANASLASIGWCFGGSLSLQSALLAGKQAKGCVMYYGRPETDVATLKSLQTDVLGIFGKRDKGIPPTTVAAFADAMKKAGKTLILHEYDADHAFANPSNPVYDKAATADAYAHTLAYLKKRL